SLAARALHDPQRSRRFHVEAPRPQSSGRLRIPRLCEASSLDHLRGGQASANDVVITYIPQSLWDAQDLVEMKARGEILFRTDNRKPLSLIRDTGGSAYNAADPSARPIWSPR